MEWNDAGRRALEDMYYVRQMTDREIGEAFGVTKEQVKYRRRKFNVTFQGKMLRQFADNNAEVLCRLNEDAKGRLLMIKDTDSLAALLGDYAFRNSPMERLYKEGRLAKEEYKEAVSFVSGKLSGILDAACKNEWLMLELLYNYYEERLQYLEPAVPDRDELEILFMDYIG